MLAAPYRSAKCYGHIPKVNEEQTSQGTSACNDIPAEVHWTGHDFPPYVEDLTWASTRQAEFPHPLGARCHCRKIIPQKSEFVNSDLLQSKLRHYLRRRHIFLRRSGARNERLPPLRYGPLLSLRRRRRFRVLAVRLRRCVQ